jgi:hypothetical protein
MERNYLQAPVGSHDSRTDPIVQVADLAGLDLPKVHLERNPLGLHSDLAAGLKSLARNKMAKDKDVVLVGLGYGHKV